MTGRRLVVCKFEDLAPVDARGFCIDSEDAQHTGFIVRQRNAVFAYRNVCPHAGNPLHWKPHAFLTKDRSLIMCSVHGAIFDIESGRCVGGPCRDRALTPLLVAVEAGDVIVYPG